LAQKVKELLQEQKYLETFYILDVDEIHITSKLQAYLPQIEAWSKSYFQADSGQQTISNTSAPITEIIDIEENIWSPFMGFKGNQLVNITITLFCWRYQYLWPTPFHLWSNDTEGI